MKPSLNIVKVGGAVVEDAASLATFLNSFADLGRASILVHGGGRRATKVAGALGVASPMIAGRRVTSAQMLDVAVMVYSGVGKQIAAGLQSRGLSAVSLCGADLAMVRSHRRPPVEVDGLGTVDYGYVGDVDRVDSAVLSCLIGRGVVPVLAPLSFDGKSLLNTNADTIASCAAMALSSDFDVTLIYCFEHRGVLRDLSDEASLIPHIHAADFEDLKASGTIGCGMLPKISNAVSAVSAGVSRVVICRFDSLGEGTIIER